VNAVLAYHLQVSVASHLRGTSYISLAKPWISRREAASPMTDRKGFAELELAGFIRVTVRGLRQAGGAEPSRYALTWLPTMVGTPDARQATNDWQDVLARIGRDGVGDVRQARRWLKSAVDRSGRGQKRPSRRDIEGAPQTRGRPRLQVRGDDHGTVILLTPQGRGGAVGN